MTPAKIYADLVAFKDRLVEAYVRGAAEEQAERHPVPPAGTCGLCGRSDDVAAERARSLATLRKNMAGYVDPRPPGVSAARMAQRAAEDEERKQ